MSHTAPIALSVGRLRLELGRFWGWLIVPMAGLLVYRREWGCLQLLLFTLTLLIPSIVVFSGKGMTHYACYPQILLAIGLALCAERLASCRRPAQTS